MRATKKSTAKGIALLAATTALWLATTGTLFAAGQAQASDPEANLPFIFAVYTVTWVAFFAYAFYMTRRQSDLKREIETLRREMEEKKG